MNHLGKSVITDSELLSLDRIIAEIEAVEADGVAQLAATLLAQERLSAAGIGPSERLFRKAVERIAPELADRPAVAA
jgi:predicted Zn-dependent peptidase